MKEALLNSGLIALSYCFIWAWVWLECLQDPKGELDEYFAQRPREKKLIAFLNKIWWPILLIGLVLILLSNRLLT